MIQWFKNNKWKIYTIIAIVCVISLTILYIVKYRQLKEALVYEQVYDTGKDSMRYYKNIKGDTVYILSEKTKDELTAKQSKKIDSLQKLLNVKPSEIVKYVSISTKQDLKNSSTKIDTIVNDSARYYSYADSYKDYEAVSTRDSLIFKSFNVYDSINAFFVRKKVGNKYFNELNVKNSNPDVKITGLSNVQFEEPKEKSRWSVGVSIGYNPFTNRPTASIGVNFDLIRFNKKSK